MEEFNLYKDIQARTGGEIFLGVVGPVRTGKSTFIRRFMEEMVLPNLAENEKRIATDDYQRERKNHYNGRAKVCPEKRGAADAI